MFWGLCLVGLAVLGCHSISSGDQPTQLQVPAPELADVTGWINSEPLTLAQLKGKVVVVHFYAFQCFNCIRNQPSYKRWQTEFEGKDVVILGIHTPETNQELQEENVRKNAKSSKLIFPIALDTNSTNWKRWSNRYWPAVYLIDRKGIVRWRWYGELNYQGAKGEEIMRQKIADLLGEK